jgi:hypothetical protein
MVHGRRDTGTPARGQDLMVADLGAGRKSPLDRLDMCDPARLE